MTNISRFFQTPSRTRHRALKRMEKPLLFGRGGHREHHSSAQREGHRPAPPAQNRCRQQSAGLDSGSRWQPYRVDGNGTRRSAVESDQTATRDDDGLARISHGPVIYLYRFRLPTVGGFARRLGNAVNGNRARACIYIVETLPL